MIDLHCHILNDLDDGATTVLEGKQMARAYVRSGYHTVAATPHMVPGTAWMPSIGQIRARVAALNQAIHDDGLRLEILAGMEIALDPQIPDLLDENRLQALGNSSCLLIEPSFQQLPPGWERVIFSILSKGYSVLMAHPERCVQLATNPGLVDRLIGSGVYLQVNWGSFFGQYGQAVARTARRMAKSGQIHCLATDSHHPGWHSPPRMQATAAKLRMIIGEDNLQRLSVGNPIRLLNGEVPQPMIRSEVMTRSSKKPWWQFW